MTGERLKKQIAFLVEADKLKHVLRRTVLTDGSRRENDAEHSWHLALMAMVLEEYAGAQVDMQRVLRLTVVHDLVEIYAGDTFAYDASANADKRARESAAADRLFDMLPEDQAESYRALWGEYDAQASPEARFACAMDRLEPLLFNYLTGGHTWKLGDVKAAQPYARIEPMRESAPALWALCDQILQDAVKKGFLDA